jgi:hypothetical protein
MSGAKSIDYGSTSVKAIHKNPLTNLIANYSPISIGSKLKHQFCLLINFLNIWMASFSLWCMDNYVLPYCCKKFIAMKIHL